MRRFALALFLVSHLPCPALTDDENDEVDPSIVIYGPPPPEPPEVIARDEMGRVTLRATRISEPIVLDGELDDAVYARVPSVGGFIQRRGTSTSKACRISGSPSPVRSAMATEEGMRLGLILQKLP